MQTEQAETISVKCTRVQTEAVQSRPADLTVCAHARHTGSGMVEGLVAQAGHFLDQCVSPARLEPIVCQPSSKKCSDFKGQGRLDADATAHLQVGANGVGVPMYVVPAQECPYLAA